MNYCLVRRLRLTLALMLIDHTSFYRELDPGDKISRDRESALKLAAAQHLATPRD
jgi:hypothetical protein